MTILFYPELLKPEPLSRVYRVLQGVNWVDYHSDPAKYYDLHIFWSYTKRRIKPDSFTLQAKDVINGGCWDVGKERVNDIFNDIRINPGTYNGICVEKYNMQGGHHFHRLVKCPTSVREGYIYQKYIENKEYGFYYKYRIYYADGIDYVLKTYKQSIFLSDTAQVEVVPKEALFTVEQEKEFIRKCKLFGIDFGEFDVMIDEGGPVVVDVNNVVGGGFVQGLTGTQLHKDIDDTFLTFINNRYDKASKVQ